MIGQTSTGKKKAKDDRFGAALAQGKEDHDN